MADAKSFWHSLRSAACSNSDLASKAKATATRPAESRSPVPPRMARERKVPAGSLEGSSRYTASVVTTRHSRRRAEERERRRTCSVLLSMPFVKARLQSLSAPRAVMLAADFSASSAAAAEEEEAEEDVAREEAA